MSLAIFGSGAGIGMVHTAEQRIRAVPMQARIEFKGVEAGQTPRIIAEWRPETTTGQACAFLRPDFDLRVILDHNEFSQILFLQVIEPSTLGKLNRLKQKGGI